MDRDLKTESSRGTLAHSAISSSFRIRLARPDEIARLREIEDKAGEMFSGLGLNDDTLDSSFPIDDLIRLVGMKQAWVACTEDDRPVGMVFASVREGAVYVEELDVMPEFGRRGLGSRLLNCVCDWAREQRCAASHPLDLPRCAVERAVLQKTWLQRSAACGVDSGHAGDP